ncbi:hypothetical protein, partial [Spirillospora albida]|uniref:hypothetical protein n=1 Tax=Spirillospora albida TaxID=58123 RepID=UPI0004C0978D
MPVVVTAGHAGHGKSSLVRALAGLGAAPGVAFADLPAALPAWLAAAGPASAVLFAVAADRGWREQSQEHLDALAALGVRHGVLAITFADAADPRHALRQARDRLAGTVLRGAEAVPVSTATGAGLAALAAALDRLAGRLPVPDPDAPVRLWADGAHHAAGTAAITGTLSAGTLHVGDELLLMPAERRVVLTAIETAGESRTSVRAPARVTAEFPASRPPGGGALVTPGRWTPTSCVDVRTRFGAAAGRLARRATLHVGAAAVPVRLRPLGPDTARLTLNARLPLHAGDTGVLRAPEQGTVAGVSVLDLRPPPLVRPGAGAARARELASWPDRPDGRTVLRRHGLLRRADLPPMGCAPPPDAIDLPDGWLADPAHWAALRGRLAAEVARHAAAHPAAPGLPMETLRLRLGLPSRRLVPVLAEPPLRIERGRVHAS